MRFDLIGLCIFPVCMFSFEAVATTVEDISRGK